MALGDGLGGFITGMFGSANDYAGPNQTENPADFQWGGSATGANDRATALQNMGAGYAGSAAPTVSTANSTADYGGANQTAQQQQAYSDYLKAAATGQGGPTAADYQLQKGNDQAIMAQQSMAASARGGGSAGALAQYRAQQQGGQISAQTAQAAGTLRAQEQQQAMGLYQQQLAQQRAQYLQQQGLSQQAAQAQAQL
jgi:hypothetical protein